MSNSSASSFTRAREARAAGNAVPHRAWMTPRDFWERVDPRPAERDGEVR